MFTRDAGGNWTQQAYLKASNTESRDFFGHSVALSGDTLVVGAPEEDSRALGVNGDQSSSSDSFNSGAVYVFTRDLVGTWSQRAYVKASNTGFDDRFGRSVALSGDTLAVGANRERSNATGVNGEQWDDSLFWSGAAYVFTRDVAGNWTQQAYLKASNTDDGDRFGYSVSLSGDTLAIGASSEDSIATGVNGDESDNSMTRAGAVYMFSRDAGGNWTQQAYLKASNPDAEDWFGESVALSGDTLAISARGEDSHATGVNGDESDNSASGSGAVYVLFRDAGGNWTQQAYLKASNTGAGDYFGTGVALSGDTVAIGPDTENSNATGVNGDESDNSASGAGAAYVFSRDAGGNWTQQAYLKASNTGAGDYFGTGVALSGDTVAIGARYEDSVSTGINGNQADNSASNSGAVYVYR